MSNNETKKEDQPVEEVKKDDKKIEESGKEPEYKGNNPGSSPKTL